MLGMYLVIEMSCQCTRVNNQLMNIVCFRSNSNEFDGLDINTIYFPNDKLSDAIGKISVGHIDDGRHAGVSRTEITCVLDAECINLEILRAAVSVIGIDQIQEAEKEIT